MECPDFLEFQDTLKKMRTLDDKIIYSLNTSIPTESFRRQLDPTAKCADLYSQLLNNYSEREAAIKKCIVSSAQHVKKLKEEREIKQHDTNVLKSLKAEQTKLRLLRSELSVEEVIKENTQKVFNEKCRTYFKPNAGLLSYLPS